MMEQILIIAWCEIPLLRLRLSDLVCKANIRSFRGFSLNRICSKAEEKMDIKNLVTTWNLLQIFQGLKKWVKKGYHWNLYKFKIYL